MKSVKQIRILTYGTILVIFLLQGIWMSNAFRLTQKQLETQVNDVFKLSTNRELIIRTEAKLITNEEIGSVVQDYETGSFGTPQLLLQDLFSRRNHSISFPRLDTIFHAEIARQQLYGKFIINRINPKTGEVLETTDPKGMGVLKGALVSEIIPIRIDGSEGVQVLLLSPYRSVFRQMIFALFLSLLLILFVGYTLFFVMRSFTKEHHLRRLQNDFSHALMHNMASPLQTIYQVNAMMKDDRLGADTEKRKKHIDLAQQQIINLQALTNRILTIANAEESKLKIQPETLNLNDIVCTLTEKFSLQAKKNVHFNTHFSPDVITLQADITLLHNAISNLVDNSIKYSGAAVNIHISGEQDKTGTFIYIKDDGYGISTKDQKKIFTNFERGKAVKRNEARGFGLGLNYVKKVMEAHGGTISLFSEEGKGSEFVLYLPGSVKNNFDKTRKDDKDTLG